MYDIDPTHAFLLIKALSQRAGDVFGLPENAGAVVQPVEVAPSGTASEVSSLMTCLQHNQVLLP